MTVQAVSGLDQFCQSLWERQGRSSRDEQIESAEEFLRYFGWEDPSPIACPGDVAATTAVSYLLQHGVQAGLAAHFVTPGILKPPGALVERGLDFCEATRILVNATQAMRVRYAFVTDFCRAYLYDALSEDLLLAANAGADIAEEFTTVLERSSVLDGSMDELRRHPRSHAARQFREWAQRWHDTLVMDWRAAEEAAWTAVDRLVVIRYLAEQNALERPGWRLSHAYADLLREATGAAPQGSGSALSRLCKDMWMRWNADMFEPEPRLEAILAQDDFSVPLLREFVLLSRGKFEPATVLESFNYGEAPEKARVRMIPEENEDRRHYLGKQTIETIDEARVELDLEEEGYRAISHWFDALVEVYDRLAVEYDRLITREQPAEADLIAWSEADAGRPKALQEPLQYAMEHGLVVYCTSPRQRRTARLMLYLHFVDCCRQRKSRILRFPQVMLALHQRPAVLESDRRRIYGGDAHAEWEAM